MPGKLGATKFEPISSNGGYDADDFFDDDGDMWQDDTNDLDDLLESGDLDETYGMRGGNSNPMGGYQNGGRGNSSSGMAGQYRNTGRGGGSKMTYEDKEVSQSKKLLRIVAIFLIVFVVLLPMGDNDAEQTGSFVTGVHNSVTDDDLEPVSNIDGNLQDTPLPTVSPTKHPKKTVVNEVTMSPTEGSKIDNEETHENGDGTKFEGNDGDEEQETNENDDEETDNDEETGDDLTKIDDDDEEDNDKEEHNDKEKDNEKEEEKDDKEEHNNEDDGEEEDDDLSPTNDDEKENDNQENGEEKDDDLTTTNNDKEEGNKEDNGEEKDDDSSPTNGDKEEHNNQENGEDKDDDLAPIDNENEKEDAENDDEDKSDDLASVDNEENEGTEEHGDTKIDGVSNDNKDEECKDADEEITIKGKTETCQYLNEKPKNLKFCSWKKVNAVCLKSCGLCGDNNNDDFDNDDAEITDDLAVLEEEKSDSPSAVPSESPSASPSEAPSETPSGSISSPIDSSSESSSSGTESTTALECKDLEGKVAVKDHKVDCKWLGKAVKNLKYCAYTNVSTHCKESCGLCDVDDDFDDQEEDNDENLDENDETRSRRKSR